VARESDLKGGELSPVREEVRKLGYRKVICQSVVVMENDFRVELWLEVMTSKRVSGSAGWEGVLWKFNVSKGFAVVVRKSIIASRLSECPCLSERCLSEGNTEAFNPFNAWLVKLCLVSSSVWI
jgi:hypothetical protein